MQYSQKSTDTELIEGCSREHRLAQKYLYQRYFGKMMSICMRYTKNRSEAEDVLNRSFLKVFRASDQYKPTGSLSGWIAKIVFRTTIDYIRQQVRYKEAMDFNAEKEDFVEAEVIEQLYAEDLFQLIQVLPATTRTVFSLYVIDGYKHREIAEMLEISENTSKWHLSVGRKKLQEALSRNQNNNKRSLTL